MDKSPATNIRIKFCGITRPEDAALASALGADAIGMIFYDKSPRNVSLEVAKEIVASVNPMCSLVAVVVNPSEQYMQDLLSAVPVHIIQFHGDESAEFCARFNKPFFKAIRMQEGLILAQKCAEYTAASALLLDTYDKSSFGGTGKVFDWSVLTDSTKNKVGQPDIILAGGLSADNIEQAIQQTRIYNLDINSGIESAPGVKDHDKMRAIMQIKTNQTL